MPLLHRAEESPNLIWGLWHITEDETTLKKILPISTNFQELSAIRHSQKRRQWLAVRCLLQAILPDRLKAKNLEVVKDQFGKPHVEPPVAHISFSHAGLYAAAMLNTAVPCGIDVEAPSTKVAAIAHKFMSAQEADWVGKNQRNVCLLWCAKEALYKLYGRKLLIFKDDIRVMPDKDQESEQLIGEIRKQPSSKHTLKTIEVAGLQTVFTLD